MHKIDHVRKVIYIIVGILTIISLVFSLYKKIGKAASDVNSPIIFSPPPYLFGNNIGSSYLFDNSLFSSIISDVITRRGNNYHDETIIIVPYSNELFVNVINRDNFPLSSVVENGATLFSYSYCGVYSFSGTFLRQYFSGNIGIRLNDIFETLDNRDYYKLNTSIDGYPVFVYSYSNLVVTDTNLPFFSPFPQDIVVGGHSKGGVLANYQDSSDLLENSSDIPPLDDSSVSTQQGFWDKIIGFFSRSYSSFNSWMLTLGDYLGQILDKLQEFFTSVYDTLVEGFTTLWNWLSDIFNKISGIFNHTDSISDDTSDISTILSGVGDWIEDFWDNFDDKLDDFVEDRLWGKLPDIMKAPFRIFNWFYTHGLKNGEFDFLTLIEYLFAFDSSTAYNTFAGNKYGDFILDVKDFFSNFFTAITGVTASDRVFFTIDLGNHFGVDFEPIEIDFSWYSSIRDQFLPYFMAFVYISVIWLFFKRLPDIIRGVAGDISSFEDNLPHQFTNITETSAGTYTSKGVRSRSGSRVENSFVKK